MISEINSINYYQESGLGKNDLFKMQARSIIRQENPDKTFSSRVWKKIDNMFDFGSSKNISLKDLTGEEQDQYLKITAALLKKGIVGWQYYEINGQIEKHFLVASLGDSRLYGGEPVKWNKGDGYY